MANSPSAVPSERMRHAKRREPSALAATLRKLTQRMSHYGCRVCGFRGQQYYWQCPGCSRWDSYGPRPGEESVS